MAKRERTPELDLHGVRHCDVPDTLHRFLTKHWGTGKVNIITGHSDAMRSIIRTELVIYEGIRSYVQLSNPGVMVIEV